MRHSRVRKANPVIIFHHKDKTGGGDGGQRRGCQQRTLGKHGEKAAVKPVIVLSRAASEGLQARRTRVMALYRKRREELFRLETLPTTSALKSCNY